MSGETVEGLMALVDGYQQCAWDIALDSKRAAVLDYANRLFNTQDAARYRWLRDHSVPPHNFYISVPDEFNGVRYGPQEVDAYIDAAILAAQGGKKL